MADKKQLVSSILGTLNSQVNGSGLAARPEIATYALGTESMDSSTAETAKVSLDKLQDIVDATIDSIVSQESYAGVTFTDAQLQAARSIAGLALDPVAATKSLTKLKPATTDASANVVNPLEIGVEDIVDPMSLSAEAFDGEAINNALYFSVTYNLMAATQDSFGEAFFPTITIDPTVSGATIESEYISLYNEIEREITGTPDGDKFNKIPIVKAIYDNELFSTDKNKVVPVLRPESADLFIEDLSFVDKSNGEEVTTAPVKFGKKFSLLGVSQTDSMLAKGVMDNTDALDRRMVVKDVYYAVAGKDSDGNDITEYFKFAAEALPHSNFTYSTQDHNKDLALSFNTSSVYVNTSTTTTATGAASAILAGLPEGHTVVLNVVIHGEANTQRGDVVAYGNQIEVVEVRDAAGNKLPTTSADYAAIVAAFNGNTTLAGYTLEAYRTNSNLRNRGQLITSDRYTQIYTVPLRSGITVLAPINNATGNDNDASKINSQITVAGIRTSVHAVKTLVEYADQLMNITANGTISDATTLGVGRHHVNAYYNEIDMDMSTYVDSIKSTDRLNDIQATLLNQIKNEATQMGIESNYFIAHEVLRGNVGGKKTVLVGTDPKIAQYITNNGGTEIDLGDDLVAKIVSTPNALMKGKIVLSFGVFDADRNTVPNPLNFGQLFWSPTITTDVVRTVSGSTVRELTTMPRFLHVVNLPVISVVNVSQLDGTLGKVNVNFKTV